MRLLTPIVAHQRMQAMETKGQELMRKKATLLTERRMLLDAVQNLVDAPAPTPQDDGDVDMDALFSLIASAEDVRRLKAEAVEEKLAELGRTAGTLAPPPPPSTASPVAPPSTSTAQAESLVQVRALPHIVPHLFTN